MNAISKPSSFNTFVLQNANLKTLESVWNKYYVDRFEDLAGPENYAYIRNRSVGTALSALNNHIKDIIDE